MRDVNLSGWLRRAAAFVPMAFFACDGQAGQSGESGEGDEVVSVAGFTLSSADESDDGFTDGADLTPILDELGVDGEEEEGDVPPPGEVDGEAMPGDGPERIGRTVLVTWGQPRLNPELAGVPTEWVGAVRTDVGAVKVLRTLKFERGEDGADKLVRDEDPQAVSFETTTTVHHDGGLVRLVLPRDASALIGDFHFDTGHFAVSVPLARLVLGGEASFAADESGNRVTIASHLPHRCPHGLTRLQWERRNAAGGVFGGKVFGKDGEVAGYAVGLWGVVDGRPRLKGAMLGPDRSFRGRLKGVWVPFGGERPEGAGPDGEDGDADAEGTGPRGGTFHARWLGAGDAVRGVVGGMFQVGETAGEGTAHGFWRMACDGPSRCEAGAGPMPEPPPPASCECEASGAEESCGCEARPPETCVAAEEPTASE